MALLIFIDGWLNKKHDILILERITMGPYGDACMAWEIVFHAIAIITPEKFYDHWRRKQYVSVWHNSTSYSPVVTFLLLVVNTSITHAVFLQEHCRPWCSQRMLPAHSREHTLPSSRTLWHVCLHDRFCNSSSSWQKDFSFFEEMGGWLQILVLKTLVAIGRSYSWSLRLTLVLGFYSLSRCDHNLLGGCIRFRVWEVHTGRHK